MEPTKTSPVRSTEPRLPPEDLTRGRSAGTPENPLHDPTRGRSAGSPENPLRDLTRSHAADALRQAPGGPANSR